jgi:hypothetical protein
VPPLPPPAAAGTAAQVPAPTNCKRGQPRSPSPGNSEADSTELDEWMEDSCC